MTTTALQRALCAREGFSKNKRYLLSAAVSMIYNSSGGGGGREFWSKFFIKNDEMKKNITPGLKREIVSPI